jgi:IclR family transcriptional regulator, acetate operon repressor
VTSEPRRAGRSAVAPLAHGHDRRHPSPSAATVVDLLILLSLPGAEPASLRTLSARLGASRSTLHRILTTLEAKGVVALDEGGYTLGPRAAEIGRGYRSRELRVLAEPFLRELYADSHETVNLAVPDAKGMLVVAGLESQHPLRISSWIGKHDAYHASALGKSYLGTLSSEALDQLLDRVGLRKQTPATITERERLIAELDRWRPHGYSVDDEESVSGMRCVGAPIIDGEGQAVAAISISAPVGRLTPERFDQVGALVRRAAAAISAVIG